MFEAYSLNDVSYYYRSMYVYMCYIMQLLVCIHTPLTTCFQTALAIRLLLGSVAICHDSKLSSNVTAPVPISIVTVMQFVRMYKR
jgi:hypothetical protein